MRMFYSLLLCILPSVAVLAQPVSRGLIAYYPFNGNTRDTTINGNNCQNANVAFTAGVDQQTNTALLCNGSNTLATTSFPLGILRDFSFSTFIKINVVPGPGELRLVFGLEQFSELYLSFGISTDSGLGFRFISGGTAQPFVSYPFDSVVNRFAHVAIVRSNRSLRLYVKGILADTSIVNSSNVDGTGNLLNIGGSPLIGQFGAGGFFNGVVDDLRIYNRALTQAEVDTLAGLAQLTALKPRTNRNILPAQVLTHDQLSLLVKNEGGFIVGMLGNSYSSYDIGQILKLSPGSYHFVNYEGRPRRIVLLD